MACSITVLPTHKKHNIDDDTFDSNFTDKLRNTPPQLTEEEEYYVNFMKDHKEIINMMKEYIDNFGKEELTTLLNGHIQQIDQGSSIENTSL